MEQTTNKKVIPDTATLAVAYAAIAYDIVGNAMQPNMDFSEKAIDEYLARRAGLFVRALRILQSGKEPTKTA